MAANQDDAVGQRRINDVFAMGHGIAKDVSRAVYWWRMAAERSDYRALVYPGDAFRNGEGLPRNRIYACRLYREALMVGDQLNFSAPVEGKRLALGTDDDA